VTVSKAPASNESPFGSSLTELESAPSELEQSPDTKDTNKEEMAEQGVEQVPDTLEQNTTIVSRDEEQANAMEQDHEAACSDADQAEQLPTTEEVTPAIAEQQDQSIGDGTIAEENNELETRLSHEADETVQPTLSGDRTVPSLQPLLPSIRTDAFEASAAGADSQITPKSPVLGSDVPNEADASINTEQATPCTVVTSLAKGHVNDPEESDEPCRVHIEDTADKPSHNTVPCSTEDIATEGAPQHALVGSDLYVLKEQTTPDEIEMTDDVAKEPPYSLDTSATGAEGNLQCDVNSDVPIPQLSGASSSQPLSSIVPNENHDDPTSKGANDLAVSLSPLQEGNAAVTNETDGIRPARDISALQSDCDSHHFL
jgi:hypothetical protein